METILTFISGVLTGILGQYIGTRFVDKAKNRDSTVIRNNEFKKAMDLMPELLKEMYNDFNSSSKREFFVNISKSISFNARDYLAYYQDEHKELTSKIGYLKDKGFIIDITHTNTPKYRITEEFLDYVKKKFEA